MNREKELLLRMTGTIVTIVLCLAAMGFSAFAYFSHSISSGMNVIQAAHFDVVVTLKDVRDASKEVSADDTGEQNGTDTGAVGGSTSGSAGEVLIGNRLDGCEAKIYTFEIKVAEDAQTAQTGYCKIVIGNGASQQVYYTTQLYLHLDESKGQKNALTIEIDMTNGSGYSIEFIPQWGTSSHYAVAQDKLLGENGSIPFEPVAPMDQEIAGSDEGAAGDEEGAQTESESGSEVEPGVKEYYTVVSGDTLREIATRYGLTQNELYEFNKDKIENQDILTIGQVLKIPLSKGGAESETVTDAATETATESSTETATEAASEAATESAIEAADEVAP